MPSPDVRESVSSGKCPVEMKRRIKVLSVLNEIDWGGDESRLLSMAVAIDRSRFEHVVLTLLEHPSDMQYAGLNEREKQYREMGVMVKSLSREEPDIVAPSARVPGRVQRKMAVLRRARRLARVVKRWNIDVLDARTAAYLSCALAGRMTGTPTAITYYGDWGVGTLSWPLPIVTALLMADHVLTDSIIRAEQFRAKLRCGKQKVVVIPNGIPRPTSVYDRRQARRLFGLPEDPDLRVIGQVARVIPYKGQHVLLQAAPRILARYPNTAFLIVGYTLYEDYWQNLRRLAEGLGIADRVRLVSYPGSIGDVWQAIDVHAHPSLFDSLPIAIAESMSLGKPAVVTSAGGIPEIVGHGCTGLVVPPGDPAALAGAILQLFEDEKLGHQLGEAARMRYEQRYRPEIMTSALEELFMRMAG